MAVGKHRCTNCKGYFPTDSMVRVTAGNFCKQECIIEYGMRKTNKLLVDTRKAKKKVNSKEKSDYYAKDLPKQKKLTQDVFNKLRKLQEYKWFADRNLPPTCISCGKENMDWCCSHFKTVASQGAIRYDTTNTHLACNRYCNKALSGNINGNKTTRGYIQGLHDRFGEKEANRIIAYCKKDRVKEWECDELIQMRKEMNIEIRQLEKELI